MANVIKLKNGTSTPDTGDIADKEVAIDLTAQSLYVNDSSTIKQIGLPTTGGTIDGDLTVQGDEGAAGIIYLNADEGDDNADKWKFEALANGSFNLASYATGSWVVILSSKSDGRVSGEMILDQDDMVDNDGYRLATQQSIKAYVDETQESIMVHNFYISSTAMNYIPFGGSQTESTSTSVGYTDDQLFIAPYDGKITKVFLYNDYSSTATPGVTTVNMGTNGAVVADMCSQLATWTYQTVLPYAVDQNNTFSAGDIIRIGINTTSAARYVTMTTVWQYDRTT